MSGEPLGYDGCQVLNICQCGAQAGYPHKPDCPWPYFGAAPTICERWKRDRAALREQLARAEAERAPESPCRPGERPALLEDEWK